MCETFWGGFVFTPTSSQNKVTFTVQRRNSNSKDN